MFQYEAGVSRQNASSYAHDDKSRYLHMFGNNGVTKGSTKETPMVYRIQGAHLRLIVATS